jgi:JmjC domain, hydroxylase
MDKHKRQLSPSLDPNEVPGWPQLYPGLAQARDAALEVHQGVGQALFVPSGWHHSVSNLEDTVSINHNWFNGFNIACCVRFLLGVYERAEALLDDCRCALPGRDSACAIAPECSAAYLCRACQELLNAPAVMSFRLVNSSAWAVHSRAPLPFSADSTCIVLEYCKAGRDAEVVVCLKHDYSKLMMHVGPLWQHRQSSCCW